MKKFIIFTTLFLSTQLFSQTPKQLWDDCFTDTSKGSPSETDMATDIYGNTYTTGYFEKIGDFAGKYYFVTKTDPFGIKQWVRFSPPDTSKESRYKLGKAIAVDNNGNVFVAGISYDTICNICTIEIPHQDMFTIKYNSQGEQLWMNWYKGPDKTYQSPNDIKIDADGNVLIVGEESKYNNNFTLTSVMMTQKIKPNGITYWLKKLPNSIGNAITLDNQNNITIAGADNTQNLYQLQKPKVVKYNPVGDTLWTRVFNEPGKNGRLYFVETDNNGNIYVNGQTDTVAFQNKPRIITIKYSPTGDKLWNIKDSNYTNTLPRIFGDFKIDDKGNAYVAGYITSGTFQTKKWIVTKYNKNGKEQWSSVYGGIMFSSFYPCGLQVDKQGNVYVAGASYISDSRYHYAFTTIKYSPLGVQQWIATYPKSTKSNGFPNAIGLDASNNVYVSGRVEGSLCTVKYESTSSPNLLSAIVANNKEKNNSFTVYPNPCTNYLFIHNMGLTGTYSYTIYSASGKLVVQNKGENFSTSKSNSINVSLLAKGVYLLNISDGKNTSSQKFMKE